MIICHPTQLGGSGITIVTYRHSPPPSWYHTQHTWETLGCAKAFPDWQTMVFKPKYRAVGISGKSSLQVWEKNGKMGVSGRICLYVACYDFVLGFNVSSSPLMFFQVGFWG